MPLEPRGAEPARRRSFETLNLDLVSLRTYTIGEISRHANVSRHTLRYWEKALGEIITPLRTEGGQRRYTDEHLLMVEEVKRLKRKGFTLTAIYEELSQSLPSATVEPHLNRLDLLADYVAEAVRTSVYRFFKDKRDD